MKLRAVRFSPRLKMSHLRWSIEQAKISRGECRGGEVEVARHGSKEELAVLS